MIIVYVLRSQSSGKLYTGQTEKIERRIEEHQQGIARYTKGRGPWDLIYFEEYSTRADAMKREKYLKSGMGRAWLKSKLDSVNGRASPPEAD